MLTDFKTCFTVGFYNNFAARPLLYFPLHLKRVTTLPCETSAADMFDVQLVTDDVSTVCDLGVDVDSSLKFDGHINRIVAKAYSRIGILFRGFFSRDIAFLRKAYTVYVRPILEYASSVWSPHFIKYINSIENVQRHFTKRISSITELPYLERLAVMDLEPLELRRIKTDLTMYFKIYNNLSALSSDHLPCDNSVRTYHSRRKCEYIIGLQPFCRTQLFAIDF